MGTDLLAKDGPNRLTSGTTSPRRWSWLRRYGLALLAIIAVTLV